MFADRTIGSVDMNFTRSGVGASGTGAAAGGAISASQGLAPAAPTLDLGRMLLPLGSYNVTATATDWVGNVSGPAHAVIFIIGDDLSNVVVYPNPYDVRKHSVPQVKFANTTDPATVKIFTVSGHFVRKIEAVAGVATWDLKNDSGDNVASGLYIYMITNRTGQKARGQVAVVR